MSGLLQGFVWRAVFPRTDYAGKTIDIKPAIGEIMRRTD